MSFHISCRGGVSPPERENAVYHRRDGKPVPYGFLCGYGAGRRASNARPYTTVHFNGGSKPPPYAVHTYLGVSFALSARKSLALQRALKLRGQRKALAVAIRVPAPMQPSEAAAP